LEARITSINMKGMVTIRFNRPLKIIANATELLSNPKIMQILVKDDYDAIMGWKVKEFKPD
jgi:hypothetical protein